MWHQYIRQEVQIHLKNFIYPLLRPKRVAVFEACLIGIVSGLAAVILKEGAGWLGSLRIAASLKYPPWLLLPIFGAVGGLVAGLLVERLAPEAGGSGVPQVKAALSGMRIPLNFPIAMVKMFTTILTVGSGLTLGRQGPTVQIGASLAAWISRLVPTSPSYRRQLIACGAAAGLAAGFNAPIAGVLFVVEDLMHDVSGITLGPAIIASFVGAVVSQMLGGESLYLDKSSYLDTSITGFLHLKEIPFYIILGMLAGLLGTVFSRGIIATSIFQRQLKLTLPWRIAITGLISGLIIASLPESFRNHTGLRELLGSNEANLKWSFIAFAEHFLLTIFAASSGAPGGFFAPSLVIGSALGQIVGICQSNVVGIEQPTIFALAGMGAFFCAVSRAPMTAVVIIFEKTQDFRLVLPLMIVSIVALLMAEKIDKKSLSDRVLDFKGLQLKKEKSANDYLSNIRADEVMHTPVETLDFNLTLDEVKQKFSNSHHRGFPALDDSGLLVGIVTQTDLAYTRKRELSGDTLLKDFMTPHPMTVKTTDNLSEVLYLLHQYKLSRLPVMEGRHLVGIITDTDIIRIESEQIGKTNLGTHSQKPSYIVYQTRSPQIGNGRLLVPLSNPSTAPALLKLAAVIARQRNYELECLQVLIVPRQSSPDETVVDTTKSRRLLAMAERIAKDLKIPMHTQIRVGHDVADTILETIKERHISLILMGWKGDYSASGRVFGSIVDTLMRQAICEVIVVKWGARKLKEEEIFKGITKTNERFEADRDNLVSDNMYSFLGWRRWLVPIRDIPTQAAAVKLLPALVSLSVKPEILLCQVLTKSVVKPNIEEMKQAAKILQNRLDTEVMATVVCATSVSIAVVDLADAHNCDVVVIGASKEGFLKQAINGNIPEAIARGCDCTVILVRTAYSE
ncbi:MULTISPECIES: chloride channel protein [unclassified Okeania]|uniref:chloride channel protein n=1 Tax=unclassified Okeania TaxID=2634635 RepID=UPI00142A3A35|nr:MULTISPECIES: chloride channel protein [unclassified Okeania]NES91811.1 universal stress protein [Okeania sp. SIO2B9]NET80075.1 universal stress protein [Okeania sp. SIO1F9]